MKNALSSLTCLLLAAIPGYASTLYFANSYNYVYNGTLTPFNQFSPNATTASSNGGADGITVSSSANLDTGVLKIYDSGNGSGGINTASEATLGDTITATGSTGGLNLTANIALGGTITDTTYTNNNTFLVVDVLPVGAFDQSNYFSNILFSAIYALGPNTTPSYAWQTYGSNILGSYPSGTNTIPINIPFNNIGTNFQIFIALETYEIGTSGVWTTDYTDPFTVTLSAPNGITLDSVGGIAGTTQIAPSPEPGTFALLLAASAWIGVRRLTGGPARLSQTRDRGSR